MHAIILVFATVLLAVWPARIGAQCDQCEGDFNGDGNVTVDEIITSVNNALNGCVPSPRYVDNGDGTIADNKTGLVWEKKSDDGSIHDQDDTYTWSASSSPDPDGTVFTSFLATLNEPPCFAGHCDWRLPRAPELQTIVDYGRYAAAIDPIFNTACEPGCTAMACGCTVLDYYWSSTAYQDPSQPGFVWNVDFNTGAVNAFEKILPAFYVRAVRGGG